MGIVDQSSETSDNDSSDSEYMSNQLLGTPKQQRFGFEDDSLCTNNGVILPMDRAQSMQIHKRSKSKKLKKKKRKKKKNVQRVDANQHVRSISIHSNIDEIESYKEYKRRRSKQQQLKKRKEQKETNMIKGKDFIDDRVRLLILICRGVSNILQKRVYHRMMIFVLCHRYNLQNLHRDQMDIHFLYILINKRMILMRMIWRRNSIKLTQKQR